MRKAPMRILASLMYLLAALGAGIEWPSMVLVDHSSVSRGGASARGQRIECRTSVELGQQISSGWFRDAGGFLRSGAELHSEPIPVFYPRHLRSR